MPDERNRSTRPTDSFAMAWPARLALIAGSVAFAVWFGLLFSVGWPLTLAGVAAVIVCAWLGSS